MNEEKWMYTPGARSTMTRLDRMAGSTRIVEIPANRPSNSTVTAGWICCGFGVLCAWFLPFAHTFFVVAFVLAIVAMSTHQVRQGTILLVVTMLCATLTVLAWIGLVAADEATIFDRLRHTVEAMSAKTPYVSSAASASEPWEAPTAPRIIVSAPSLPAAMSPLPGTLHPVTLEELSMMLRTGYSDDEVIAALQSRPLSESINGSRASLLRSLGATEKLIINLRGRAVDSSPARTAPTFPPVPVVAAASYSAPITSATFAMPAAPPSSATPSPQEKERRIQELKTQMESLDDDIRRIRVNPQDYRYWWNYYGNGNGHVNLERRDAYLKQLDQKRNDLRREKWQLEGR